MTLRTLYSADFLDSGCTLPYDATTETDNLFWTYATNFVIVSVCLVAAVVLSLRKLSTANMTVFWFLMAVGHSLAGVHHKTTDLVDTTEAYTIPMSLCILLSHGFLLRAGLLSKTRSRVAMIVWAVAVSAVVIVVCYLDELLFLGVALAAVYLAMVAIYWPNALKMIAMVICLVGLVIQGALNGTCGDDGYEECFKDCPLPDATTFNHNALFHSVWAVGLTLFAIGEWRDPTFPLEDSANPQIDESAHLVEHDALRTHPTYATISR